MRTSCSDGVNPVSADQHRKNVSAKQLLLSTAELPASQQFAFWSDALLNPAFGVHSDPLKPIDKGFRGEVEAWITPCLTYYRYSSDDVLVSRGPREITHRRMDSFCLYREHASGLGLQNKRNSGDFIIGDIDGVFAYQAHRECWLDIWLLPKAPIAPHLPAQGRPFAARLKRDHGISHLLAAFVDSLTAQMSELPPGKLEALVEPLSRLVAIAFGSPRGEHREAVRVAFVQRAKQYIARHLADPALSPASAAAALGVSERTIHVAFEPTGTSFAEFVRNRRLAECKAALASPVSADRSVADIAFGWGFQSLATFYRAFKREYGIAPQDARKTTAPTSF